MQKIISLIPYAEEGLAASGMVFCPLTLFPPPSFHKPRGSHSGKAGKRNGEWSGGKDRPFSFSVHKQYISEQVQHEAMLA